MFMGSVWIWMASNFFFFFFYHINLSFLLIGVTCKSFHLFIKFTCKKSHNKCKFVDRLSRFHVQIQNMKLKFVDGALGPNPLIYSGSWATKFMCFKHMFICRFYRSYPFIELPCKTKIGMRILSFDVVIESGASRYSHGNLIL